MTVATEDLRERVSRLPGMDRLLPALEGLPRAYLVGGAVRDLLRGGHGVDLDLALEGDAAQGARVLSERLGGTARDHERFGTATVQAEGLSFDAATTRRESYERPGALPAVEPAGLQEDLERRDFTINAMAIGLSGDELGRLYDPRGGRDDLEAGIVRVLHERSFVDDPTRLLRAVRYEVRLGFALDPRTESLAREAAATGCLGTVSGARVGDELLDLLAEPEAPAGVERLHALGLDRALHPALRGNAELVAGAALGSVETGADHRLSALAALSLGQSQELRGWLDGLGLRASERDAVLRAADMAPRVVERLREDLPPSRLHALLSDEPPETLALALGLGAPAEPVLRYLGELRHVRLEITGEDLLAAGVPESPAIGRALEEVLWRKLDGELTGRDAELDAALAVARGEQR
jgi:tRNA nucleotidyltransferase (CCA-adding enzyme)